MLFYLSIRLIPRSGFHVLSLTHVSQRAGGPAASSDVTLLTVLDRCARRSRSGRRFAEGPSIQVTQ